MTYEIKISGRTVQLGIGERYAGAVLDADGRYVYDLVLMPARPSERMSWSGALAWAKEVGGMLPTRQEQALLFAHCRSHLEDGYHWSCDKYERDNAFAWRCYLSQGLLDYTVQSIGCSAVAVRRVVL